MKFNKDKKFKIAQFTDLHWDQNNSESCETVVQNIQRVLDAERPDLVFLTGDIVTYNPAKEGWHSIAAIFEKAAQPWSVVLGNHDDETSLSRHDIFELLKPLPYFIGETGTASGVGNFVIQLQSAEGDELAALLYGIDSHGYPADKRHGDYDWVKFDQIEWYRKTSAAFTQSNQGVPLPALAFFHIPLLEYNDIVGMPTTVGVKGEAVASSKINSGLFSAFVEMGDVMGTFVGHDHVNNYIGITHNIALAYGQKTGEKSYGDLKKGGRIIELTQGKRSFNTWISTEDGSTYPYNYPFGMSFLDDEGPYQSAVEPAVVKQGLQFTYYEGNFNSVQDMAMASPVKTGVVENLTLTNAEVKDHFGFVFKGFIKIPAKGYYRFYTFSDDGSSLWIGNQEVVNNDGGHSPTRKEGIIALEAGFHPIRVLYFESYMGELLEVGMSSLQQSEALLSNEMLFYSNQ